MVLQRSQIDLQRALFIHSHTHITMMDIPEAMNLQIQNDIVPTVSFSICQVL